MSNINFPNDLTGSSTTFSSTCFPKSNEQKKKDLITRLLKNDFITIDDVLLLLDKLPETPVSFSTTTHTVPFTNTIHTGYTTGVDKELIN